MKKNVQMLTDRLNVIGLSLVSLAPNHFAIHNGRGPIASGTLLELTFYTQGLEYAQYQEPVSDAPAKVVKPVLPPAFRFKAPHEQLEFNMKGYDLFTNFTADFNLKTGQYMEVIFDGVLLSCTVNQPYDGEVIPINTFEPVNFRRADIDETDYLFVNELYEAYIDVFQYQPQNK